MAPYQHQRLLLAALPPVFRSHTDADSEGKRAGSKAAHLSTWITVTFAIKIFVERGNEKSEP